LLSEIRENDSLFEILGNKHPELLVVLNGGARDFEIELIR